MSWKALCLCGLGEMTEPVAVQGCPGLCCTRAASMGERVKAGAGVG